MIRGDEPVAETHGARTVRAAPSIAPTGTGLLRSLVRVLSILLGLSTVLAAAAAVRNVFAPGEWMYSDGVSLYHIMRARDGLAMYPPPDQSPFLMLVYWPLYITVSGLLARVAGLDTAGTLYLARGVTVAGAALACVAVAGISARCGARRWAAIVGGALFASAYVIHPWAYAARADLPAVALVLTGVWVFLRWTSPAATVLAALLLAGGFAAKQSYVVGVTALTLWCLWQREWRRGLTLATAWAAVVGATLLGYELATNGSFSENTIAGNVLPLRAQTVLQHLPWYLLLCLPHLALAAFGLADRQPLRRARDLVTWYALLAGLAGLVALSRAGSNYNHLIEVTAVLSVLAAVGFERCARLLRDDPRVALPRRPLTGALVALAAAVIIMPIWLIRHQFVLANPPDARALTELIRSTSGLVLTEHDALAVILAGKEAVGGEPLGLALLAAEGRWDPELLNARIADGTFELVVLHHPVDEPPTFDGFAWWPAGALQRIAEHYQLTGRLGGYYVYTRSASAAGR